MQQIALAPNLDVDTCANCRGTWYDDGELARHLGNQYRYETVLSNMAPSLSNLSCPICKRSMTRLEFLARSMHLEIDNCPKCRGFWLDDGEYDQIAGFGPGAAPRKGAPAVAGGPGPRPAGERAAVKGAAAVAAGQGVGAPGTGGQAAEVPADTGSGGGGGGGGGERGVDGGPASAPAGKPSHREHGRHVPGGVRPSALRPRPVRDVRRGSPGAQAGSGPDRAAQTRRAAEGTALAHYRSFDQETAADAQEISAGTYLFCLFTELPVEVFNPPRKVPPLLVGLVLVNTGMFLLEQSMPAPALMEFIHRFGYTPGLTLTPTGLLSLVTAGFLHASWFHLIGNMYFLWTFGDNVCDVLDDNDKEGSAWTFLWFYLLTMVLANLAHMLVCLTNPHAMGTVSLGASGAVSAVMAAYLRLFPRTRLYQIFFFRAFKVPIMFYICLWLGSNLAMALGSGASSPIAWGAHLGGFLAGYLLIPLFVPFDIEEIQRRRWLLA